MNQISSGDLLAGKVDGFEVTAEKTGVTLRLNIGGGSVLATLGPAYASFLAKQLRKAATEVHVEAEGMKL